jgi:cell division protein FtsN
VAPTPAPATTPPSVSTTAAPAATPRPAAPTAAPVSRATPPTGERFGVQFAAYPTAAGAEQYAAQLRTRGVPARVEGTRYPFRVRAGNFASRAEAEAALPSWRRAASNAIVVSLGAAP